MIVLGRYAKRKGAKIVIHGEKRKKSEKDCTPRGVINEQYLRRSNLIGKKYIEKAINEYDWEYCLPEGEERTEGKGHHSDIEFANLSNVEIDCKLCKVKGENLHEGTAGKINQVIVETMNKAGEFVYVEKSTFEAYVKRKEEVDKLFYVKESSPEKENGYSMFINNNLYNSYLYEKHKSLINLDHNRYNINANFSNYKNIKERKKKNGENLLFYQWDDNDMFDSFGDRQSENGPTDHQTKCTMLKSTNRNTQIDRHRFVENKACAEKATRITSPIDNPLNRNDMYNETIKSGYIFDTPEYDEENIKLTKNGLKCTIRDLQNGSYIISYTVRKSGHYYLSIFNNKKLVGNSPYLVLIKPSIAYPPNCVVYKDMNNKITILKREKKKKKKKVDQMGSNGHNVMTNPNNSSIYGKPFTIVTSNGMNTCIGGETGHHNRNGESSLPPAGMLYEGDVCKGCPTESNSGSDCNGDGSSDRNSDYSEWERDHRDEASTYVLKIREEEENKEYDNFFIQSYDAYGNKITKGNEHFEVSSMGDVKIEKVKDMNNGTYEVIYRYVNKHFNGCVNNLHLTGCCYEKHCYVTYREVKVTLYGINVKGSPFHIILKNDKRMAYLNKIKCLLPIDDINDVNIINKMYNIISSYNYIKESHLKDNELDTTNFINVNPYYDHTELVKILKKVDNRLISFMSIPMKVQLVNYIKCLNNDIHIVNLKNRLFEELVDALKKMIYYAEKEFNFLENDKDELLKIRDIQNRTIDETYTMYESLKEKKIHTLPFDFSIEDMKSYEDKLINKKRELIDKQNALIERYNNIKKMEQKFYHDRDDITNKLTQQYELHQTIYERSKNALIHTNNNLKRVTLSSIKRTCSKEKKVLSLRGTDTSKRTPLPTDANI
ncbi:conserved Plasmodium protein, unknown function [Plasmodium ovale wallikeri]|uniref:Uncharacterized protein n=1 Tax=Plasmodium ovale wallikeri TaxID=864142 RepID=A0A1A8Z4H6_PLAOA|nr:conserved Plasmodium protein, unknown function [Plasmodium ovale wallikeri]